jgi:hypothetical protein
MSPFDLVKATIVCAAVAFVIYSYPLVSQILLMGVVVLVWASYFYRTVIKRTAA